MPDWNETQRTAIAGAEACLDVFMDAFNARDMSRWEGTFNYPTVRFASGRLDIFEGPGFRAANFWDTSLGDGWARSDWDRREVIHAGAEKVHFDTRFSRRRGDGSLIGGYDSIYVVTLEDGHWGIKARSSFAP